MAAAAEVGGGIDYSQIPGLRSNGFPTGGTIWQKIDYVYGNPEDGATTGDPEDGLPCSEHEEWRRNLPPQTLDNLTWHSDEGTAEYRTGSDRKLVGVCFGSGEKFGSWDAYTLFHAVGVDPMKPSDGLCSIERGDRVLFCGNHVIGEHEATVARILRGMKQSGTAAAPKEQHVFYVLLQVGSDWKYSALKHVGYFGGYKYYLRDQCTDRELMALESSLADRFRPKSVAAVAQDAARLAKNHSGNKTAASANLQKRSGKHPRIVDTSFEQSDNDDDESDDEYA